jgi:hypothetical protein
MLSVEPTTPATLDPEVYAGISDFMGKSVVGAIGTLVQRKRHIDLSDRLVLFKDGKFPSDIAAHIARAVVPEESDGTRLCKLIEEELFAWCKANARSVRLHPRAPILEFELQGEDVILHLRPYTPPKLDPNFVRATVVE